MHEKTLSERIAEDGITIVAHRAWSTHYMGLPARDRMVCLLQFPIPNGVANDPNALGPHFYEDADGMGMYGRVMACTFGGPNRMSKNVRNAMAESGDDPQEPYKPTVYEVLYDLLRDAGDVEGAGGDFLTWVSAEESGFSLEKFPDIDENDPRYRHVMPVTATRAEVVKSLEDRRRVFTRMTVNTEDLREFLGDKFHAYLHGTDLHE